MCIYCQQVEWSEGNQLWEWNRLTYRWQRSRWYNSAPADKQPLLNITNVWYDLKENLTGRGDGVAVIIFMDSFLLHTQYAITTTYIQHVSAGDTRANSGMANVMRSRRYLSDQRAVWEMQDRGKVRIPQMKRGVFGHRRHVFSPFIFPQNRRTSDKTSVLSWYIPHVPTSFKENIVLPSLHLWCWNPPTGAYFELVCPSIADVCIAPHAPSYWQAWTA